ncbi:MAG: hypothetical protein ABFC12_05445 [Methanobacterium sp.]
MDICPVNAFTGEPFREDEPREVRYDARKCQEYLGQMLVNGMSVDCAFISVRMGENKDY